MSEKMREILFRGKRIDNGEWVNGSFCMDALEQFNGLCGVDGFIRLYDKDSGKMQMYEVDRETVGQFTGLTDKNGKKIFEGDIVMGAYKGKGVVEFTTEDVASCGCCFPYFVGSGFKADDVNLGDCEVIGNIHDNPELLEEGTNV